MEIAIEILELALTVAAAALAVSAVVTWSGMVVRAASRGERFRPWSAPELSLLARESTSRVLRWVIRPLGWGVRQPRRAEIPGAADHVPVLLIPDAGQGRAAMMFLATFLRHRGWAWVWSRSLSRSADLESLAHAIARDANTLRETTNAPSIDIVAHGIGGLASAWFIHHLGGADFVRVFVTLGTPWLGTRTAVFTRRLPELRPGAPALAKLDGSAVSTVCIWSPDTTFVVPPEAAIAEVSKSIMISGAGHVEMMTSPRIFRAVQTALTDGA